MPIFGQIYIDFAKKVQKILNFLKNSWPVWPVNFLLLTRLTRNIFPFDPPTRRKIFGWPVTRPDPWNFQNLLTRPDPARGKFTITRPDPTRGDPQHPYEKPFKCKYCKERFSWSNSLRVHERTHTGEVPFECLDCGKRFAHSSSAVRHKKKKTRNYGKFE